MQKAFFIFLGVVCALSASQAVRAQAMLDVSKITCWQFATYKVTSPKFIAIWLSGFHHGKRGDTIVDTQQLAEDADKMTAYCSKNPEVPMMQAVEAVLGSRD
jgi:acid stress chaperone HdeB